MNAGMHIYDWPRRRMLITNSNCTGGPSGQERRDMPCDALFANGMLYAKGSTPKPWCCLWHEDLHPTPPYFLTQAQLVNRSEEFAGVLASRYELFTPLAPSAPFNMTHIFYVRRDNGIQLAHGGQTTSNPPRPMFMNIFSDVSDGHPIPPSMLDIPSECADAPHCNWEDPAGTVGLGTPTPLPEDPQTFCQAVTQRSLHGGGYFPDHFGKSVNPHCPASWRAEDRPA
eukprot:CAMPEP_0115837980 /NCGR_PEP_ID=MMETSP0287-20121206/5495_1 /TAXON_ID=412157 /ORGANISM="Chrysochromulina rotalis, Strain UIO044" /LENGTH=226 /DNA_ID=CAMNT_0003291497 /DNA_START=114 /DNA_END=794 /DNA_ORIENTATION=+